MVTFLYSHSSPTRSHSSTLISVPYGQIPVLSFQSTMVTFQYSHSSSLWSHSSTLIPIPYGHIPVLSLQFPMVTFQYSHFSSLWSYSCTLIPVPYGHIPVLSFQFPMVTKVDIVSKKCTLETANWETPNDSLKPSCSLPDLCTEPGCHTHSNK